MPPKRKYTRDEIKERPTRNAKKKLCACPDCDVSQKEAIKKMKVLKVESVRPEVTNSSNSQPSFTIKNRDGATSMITPYQSNSPGTSLAGSKTVLPSVKMAPSSKSVVFVKQSPGKKVFRSNPAPAAATGRAVVKQSPAVQVNKMKYQPYTYFSSASDCSVVDDLPTPTASPEPDLFMSQTVAVTTSLEPPVSIHQKPSVTASSKPPVSRHRKPSGAASPNPLVSIRPKPTVTASPKPPFAILRKPTTPASPKPQVVVRPKPTLNTSVQAEEEDNSDSKDPGSACGYCLEEVDQMNDPRAMPCGHFFCRPCLEADNRDIDVIKCAVCRWNFHSTDVLKLPKVPQYPTKGSTDVKTVECDICDEGAKLAAIKFCMDCYKKMCDSHAQLHDDYQEKFGGNRHNSINIEEYVGDSPRFKQQTCPRHSGALILSCINCMHMFCEKCTDTDTNCKDSWQTPHRICQIKKHSGQLVKELRDYSIKLSEKEDNMASKDKAAWGKYDKLEKDVQIMLSTADEDAQNQWVRICQQRDTLKQKIYDYHLLNAGKVEKYSENINEKMDDIATMRSEINQLAKKSDTEIISKYVQTKTEAEATILEVTPAVIMKPMMLSPQKGAKSSTSTATPGGMDLVYNSKPTEIIPIWHSRSECTTAVTWDCEDVLMTAQPWTVIKHRNIARVGSSIRVGIKAESVEGITTLPSGEILLLSRLAAANLMIERYSSGLKFKGVFNNYCGLSTEHMSLTCSKNRVALLKSRDYGQVTWFNLVGDTICASTLGQMNNPTGITHLGDESFVVCDPDAQLVQKIEMKPLSRNVLTVWSSKVSSSPHSVASDGAGLVYVGSRNGGPIRILCGDSGNLLRILVSELLTKSTFISNGGRSYNKRFVLKGLAVTKNKLAVVSGIGGLDVFEIV